MEEWSKAEPTERKAAEEKLKGEWDHWMSAHSAMILSTDAGGKTNNKRGQTMTRGDRCTRMITTLSRAGRDREFHKALETVLALRGLSALTDAALEDLATQVVASEGAPRFDQNRVAAKREQGGVIFLDQYRFQRKN
jgi:hypothetical protein